MMRFATAPLALLTVACAAAPPAGAGRDPLPPPGGAVEACDASGSQSLVRQMGNASVADEARRRSGATVVRYLRPGQVVTMEYRADRLNIVLDSEGRVEAIRCG